jgi:hypothetical protein
MRVIASSAARVQRSSRQMQPCSAAAFADDQQSNAQQLHFCMFPPPPTLHTPSLTCCVTCLI